jgi:hypothetical protein
MTSQERFVHVVRIEMKLVLVVQPNVIVATASPVTIAIDRTDIDGQEPQQLIDIDQRLNRLGQFFRWCFLEDTAEIDQLLPILVGRIFGFEHSFIGCLVLAMVLQARSRLW